MNLGEIGWGGLEQRGRFPTSEFFKKKLFDPFRCCDFFVNCRSLSISNFPDILIAMVHASIRCAGSANYKVKKFNGPWFFLRHLLTKLKSDTSKGQRQVRRFTLLTGASIQGIFFFFHLTATRWRNNCVRKISGIMFMLTHWQARIDRTLCGTLCFYLQAKLV